MRVRQVHGNVVRVLKRGEVAASANRERPDGDAVVSNQPGLVLAVMVADCVPVLVVDRDGGAAAAIHAGWRGTCARVVVAAIERMRDKFGTTPGNLLAAIGPSIGPADYKVGNSLIEQFRSAGHDPADIARWFPHINAALHLDLWLANRDQLIAAGLSPDRIFTSRLSTLPHRDVFDSYRRDGESAGRMAGLIVVPKPGAA